MPDYAGALAAIRSRLEANWTDTPIAWLNEDPPETVDEDDKPTPWVFCEITGTGADIRGAGSPGDHVWLYTGLIFLHVFVPTGAGADIGYQHAVALGEIFRTQEFYNSTPGYAVRTGVVEGGSGPRIDAGDSGSDDGQWFRVTATIPFEYWHRG